MADIKTTNPKTGHYISMKNWQSLFSDDMLRSGKLLCMKNAIRQFSANDTSAHAEVAEGGKIYFVDINNAPNSYSTHWDVNSFSCSCRTKRNRRVWDYKSGNVYYTCEHEAAVLYHWEAKHGLWLYEESDAEFKARKHREELQQRKEQLKAQKETESKIILPAKDYFSALPAGGYFDVKRAAEKLKTTQYAVNRAKQLLEHGKIQITGKNIIYGSNGDQVLQVSAKIGDELNNHEVSISLNFYEIENRRCSCGHYYYTPLSDPLCEHELILLREMQAIAAQPNLGDATDLTAARFFSAMASPSSQPGNDNQEKQEKQKTLVLSPRIIIDGGEVSLTFKLGRDTGIDASAAGTKTRSSKSTSAKSNVVKNLKTLVQAYAEGSEFELTKTQTIDFSAEDFTDESLPWLTFVQRRVSESLEVNNRLQSRTFYGYNPSLKMQDSLTGAMLDQFYEIAEGNTYESVNRTNNNETGMLKVGHSDMRVYLKSEKIADSRGTFYGVLVTGSMPVILPGSSDSYVLSDSSLSKISREEENVLKPFLSAADEQGNIRFRVGLDSLPEFYYRIVPTFLQSRYIDFQDNCYSEAEQYLPPEPEFLFQMDIDQDICTCHAFVSYNRDTINLYDENSSGKAYRDRVQEDRIRSILERHFDYVDPKKQLVWSVLSDDYLYSLLTETVPELSRYGEVQGSEAFSRLKIRTAPAIQVGVGIESGLMDISVISKDVSPEELLDILNSYRAKKKYHRLKSGDYVRLTQDDRLESLDTMLDEMHMKAEDIIGKEAHLPMYRALYLDTMLKKHEELAANRDRTYRTLIKNFSTIRDADFEPPKAQSEILRPYQTYGFKWLRTLTAAGFGGILADEMGLGKTIQAITLLQSLKDDGAAGISLIVCPASLVYNWQEEFRRFAPDLSVKLVVGSASQRKTTISELSMPEAKDKPDILVTSYDLFKKDINLYHGIQFTVMFLDEAQYIKNQKAAVTKSVKAASAQYRFALTGTPVENRLAELWSIFDFLMPGFLYGYQEFSSRFETPIVKNKDEALSARLRQIVSPFILRRLKTDVLKDLPEKLEEVRYTRFEEDQRKVYDGQVVHMKQMLSGLGTSGEDKLKVLTELMRIRQICCDPSLLFEDYHGGSAKREACIELIQSAVGGGHRMLVFSQFTSMLALLEEDLKNEDISYLKLTGATPKEQRIRMVREFNEGDTPVFLISLKAGGTGLNLTGADVVIHYDPWWNIAAQNQATDRAHRIGQTNTVTVYKLIVKDSIEEKILALQEAKQDLAESVLSGDSGAITSLSADELMALLG